MAPGSIFHHISFRHIIFHHISFRSTILQSFILRSINQKYQKYLLYLLFSFIYLYQISLWQVTVKGLTTPYRVGCKLSDCLCMYWWFVSFLLLDWYLGSQTEGNTYLYFAASPFPLQGKTNTSSRSSRKNFWRRCRGDLHQAYQVPIINSHLFHYIICHLPLVFLSPTSKTSSETYKKICLFIHLSSVV